MDPRMAVAHTVSAGLTALMWSLLARALDALVRLPEHPGRRARGDEARLPARGRSSRDPRPLAGRCAEARAAVRRPAALRLTADRVGCLPAHAHPTSAFHPEGQPMKSRIPARLLVASAATGLLTLGLAGPASAHVTVTPEGTAAGSYTVVTVSVPHGCDGSPTTKVAIQIPEDILSVTPTRNSYYDVTKKMEKLDPAVEDAHGNEVTERVGERGVHREDAVARRAARRLRALAPAARHSRRDARLPDDPDLREGRDRLDRAPGGGPGQRGARVPRARFEITEAEDGHGHDRPRPTATRTPRRTRPRPSPPTPRRPMTVTAGDRHHAGHHRTGPGCPRPRGGRHGAGPGRRRA